LFSIIVLVAVMFFKFFLVFFLGRKFSSYLSLFRIFLFRRIVLLFFSTKNVFFPSQLTVITLVLQLIFRKVIKCYFYSSVVLLKGRLHGSEFSLPLGRF